MVIYEFLKWLFLLGESLTILIGMFMINRYVFLEPSLEGKKQNRFYLYSTVTIFISCVLVGSDLASILGMILCGVNIVLARKKHRIRGALNIIPICGFMNGIAIPLLVMPGQAFRFEESVMVISSLIVYVVLFGLLILFFIKGKNWRKTFQEELKYRQLQRWEYVLLWAVGMLLMFYSATLSVMPESSDSSVYLYVIYELTMKYYVVTAIMSFVLSITIIVLIMQGNKRSFYFDKALKSQKAEMEKEKVEAANKAKSTFLSSMSHEIRTPMNAIVGMTEVLLRGNHSKETVEYLNNIKVSGEALLTIINDILDFSKIESGKMDIVEGNYNPKSMINALKMIFENRALGKPIELIYNIDDDIPTVLLGDEHRLRQVIINLVNNAIKFTDSGYVKVSVESNKIDDGKVELLFSVEDTGMGIKEEELPKLFGSFQQVDVKKNHKKEGTGLGLAISKQLVELMNGSIGVESQYGKGSTFYFTVPQTIVAHTVEEMKELGINIGGADTEYMNFIAPNAHILLVDDNEMNRKVGLALLEPLRMNIDTATNGREALDMVMKNKYDLVFMDHMMPEMDGIEATREIRKLEDEYYRTLPVIALTANATSEAKEMFQREQMNDFVAKPIQMGEILKCLRRWLPKELLEEVDDEVITETNDTLEQDKVEEPTIEGIDISDGIMYCGSEKMFYELLGDFYKLIDIKIAKLEKCIADGMIKDYTIEVHALKNTARMIGAKELSAMSYELEKLGNANEIEQIKAKSQKHIELYRSYKDKLKAYGTRTVEEVRSVSYEDIKNVLTRIYDAVDTFDLVEADKAMAEFETYDIPESLVKMRTELSAYVADIAMEEVMNITKAMCDELQKLEEI